MKNNIIKIIKEYILEVTAFFSLALAMGLFWNNNLALSLMLLVTLILYHVIRRNLSDFVFSVIVLIFFQLGEIIPSYFGAWTYNNPSYLGVPVWIPLSWACCALVLKNFIKTTDKAVELIFKQ